MLLVQHLLVPRAIKAEGWCLAATRVFVTLTLTSIMACRPFKQRAIVREFAMLESASRALLVFRHAT